MQIPVLAWPLVRNSRSIPDKANSCSSISYTGKLGGETNQLLKSQPNLKPVLLKGENADASTVLVTWEPHTKQQLSRTPILFPLLWRQSPLNSASFWVQTPRTRPTISFSSHIMTKICFAATWNKLEDPWLTHFLLYLPSSYMWSDLMNYSHVCLTPTMVNYGLHFPHNSGLYTGGGRGGGNTRIQRHSPLPDHSFNSTL